MKSRGAEGSDMAEIQKPKPDNPEQSKRFKDTAKELGIDEDGEAFERAMGIIVPPKPPSPQKK